MTRYISLHNHTDFSMLDGKALIKVYVARAKALGMSHLAIMDHGTISGTFEFYTECKAAGIEPILGSEFYYVPNAERVKSQKTGERFHVGVLARNEAGFRALTELTHEAHKRYYYKPVIDKPLLETLGPEADNLVVLSGCAASKISRLALTDGLDAATDEARWWQSIFDNFYIELQHHDTEFDRKLNRRLLKIGRRLGLPWVVTNDPHYVFKEECDDHDALLAIQTGSNVDDTDRFRFDGSGYHLRSSREMARAFAEYGDKVWRPGARNTVRVARDCATDIPAWNNRTWHIPKFPDADDSFAQLKRLVRMGLRERGLDTDPAYVARTKYELKRIKKVGIADFLLITLDIIRFAKTLGRVGPGRGSTCGCLCAYLIGIHNIDSIRYNLLFERFLNVERPKMPDIDSDFEPRIRERVIAYVRDKYGDEYVMRVAAFQTMKVRGVFQALAKVHGISPADRNRYTKLLGAGFDEEAGDDDEDEDISILPPELREGYPDLARQMQSLLGVKKAISRHAAGVLIFDPDDPVRSLITTQWLPGPKKWAAQYDLKTCEKMGLMKQDILGLRTLETISECLALVGDYDRDPDEWVPDEEDKDDAVYQMLADGNVSGVFQMEGAANARGIREIGPTKFDDIVTCTSLYRAGPLGAGSDKRWLKNRRDNNPRVLHPSLEPILGSTWGEMIYQEQMMEIVNRVAGLSMTKVDEIKEIVRFKDPVKMATFTDEFKQGCKDTVGMKAKVADQLWKVIEAQSTYLFNRSHATAYSMLTYQTARLKYLYPLQYTTALIRTVLPKSDAAKAKRVAYLSELRERGFRILPPHVNRSGVGASCNPERKTFRFGLVDCSGIGFSSARRFVEWRGEIGGKVRFDDDLIEVNKKVRDTLMEVGACSSIGGPDHDPVSCEAILGFNFIDSMKPYRAKYKRKVKFPKWDNGRVVIVGQIIRIDRKTTKNGKKFVTWTLEWSPSKRFKCNVWEDAADLHALKKGSIVAVKGRWSKEWENISIFDSDEQVTILEEV